jgi:hypothetical protein
MERVGLLTKEKQEALPLKDVSVNAFVQGYLVGLESKLKYSNEGNDPAEVLFRTPVEDSFAVVGLTAVIDGRRIRADLKEKEEAKEMYEDAIASGRSAAFGEEKKGDIFSIALGNLPPGKEAEIHLTMVGELGIDAEGSVRFCLPTVLKPRYTPQSSQDPLSPIEGGEGGQVKHVKSPSVHHMTLHVSGADSLDGVSSPSHKVKYRTENNTMKVEIDEDPSSKDIVILMKPKHPHVPNVLVEPGRPIAGNTFMSNPSVMVSFFPEWKGDCSQVACEFIFVVDRSGSMSGTYIREAGETLVLFLKSIPEGCHFNVIGFGSRYEKLFKESVPYNQENMVKAVRHAESLSANLGGTELLQPLEYVFSQALIPNLTRQVFVLTDGSVSNTESVIQLVKKNSSKARCFSFGIGSGASTHLVKGIAEAGLGTAEFITGGERMQPKVIRSLKHAMQPAVTNTSVRFDLPFGYNAKVVPESVPPIFLGERTIIYGILEKSLVGKVISGSKGSVTLKGELLGGKIEHKVEFQLPREGNFGVDSVSTIHHLAGKSLIKEYERNESPGRGNKKAEIVKLSCESGVISKYTAFIAIDEEQKEPVKGSLQTWDVVAPQPVPVQFKQMPISSAPVLCSMAPMPTAYRSAPRRMMKNSAMKVAEQRSSHKEAEIVSETLSADSLESSDDDISMGIFDSGPPPPPPPPCSSSGPPPPPGSRNALVPPPPAPKSVQQSSPSKPTLPQVINLQMASGAWELTPQLAGLLGSSIDVLKSACPVSCEGGVQSVWATALVLVFLVKKMSESQDEWELVAMKAENWLKKQNVPGVTIEELKKKAEQTV